MGHFFLIPFTSFRYDPQTKSIIFANNHPFTKENYKQAGLQSEALFRFCQRMVKMEVDNVEFALLTAIITFRERKNVKARKRMEKIQEIYVDALQSYVMSHRTKDPTEAFAKLLGVLVEVRSLSNFNKRTYLNLKLVEVGHLVSELSRNCLGNFSIRYLTNNFTKQNPILEISRSIPLQF